MARPRSPAYPNFPLEKALVMISDIFEADRRNIIDRETAAKHVGYSSLSGASDKVLVTSEYYNLLQNRGWANKSHSSRHGYHSPRLR
ncbi:hypothetical protein PhaeoP30_03315 [Phaeobacter inhibens]|nr:hypothetical protein PhaeoP30_03315 [Phaeobacter inhibens]AUR09443.1 hypothetical protein PhaeoP59_03311 [Phaeobacter inhibens]AUR13319.1 hypothetical protein PhaeoP48_03372 [Phaeobacter inhibens]